MNNTVRFRTCALKLSGMGGATHPLETMQAVHPASLLLLHCALPGITQP